MERVRRLAALEQAAEAELSMLYLGLMARRVSPLILDGQHRPSQKRMFKVPGNAG